MKVRSHIRGGRLRVDCGRLSHVTDLPVLRGKLTAVLGLAAMCPARVVRLCHLDTGNRPRAIPCKPRGRSTTSANLRYQVDTTNCYSVCRFDRERPIAKPANPKLINASICGSGTVPPPLSPPPTTPRPLIFGEVPIG